MTLLGSRLPRSGSMVLLLAMCGCAQWEPLEQSEAMRPLLQSARKAPDSVQFETWFVSTKEGDVPQDDFRLWREIDEQQLPSEVRHRLAANGLRCGIAGSQLPNWLQQLVDERRNALEVSLESASQNAHLANRQQVLQTRSGRVSRLAISSQPQSRMILLVNEDGEVHGDSLENAQAFFSVRAFPQGDGRVKLELTPEVEYGQPRQRWTGREGMFILDTSRERKSYERLRSEILLSPGQTLVAGCTAEVRGLGASFFADAGPAGRQRLLLIRIGSTQVDDLFAPASETAAPIASEL